MISSLLSDFADVLHLTDKKKILYTCLSKKNNLNINFFLVCYLKESCFLIVSIYSYRPHFCQQNSSKQPHFSKQIYYSYK